MPKDKYTQLRKIEADIQKNMKNLTGDELAERIMKMNGIIQSMSGKELKSAIGKAKKRYKANY